MQRPSSHGTGSGGLPVMVSGIVFWGMVLVGLIAVIIVSREQEKILRQRIQLNALLLSATIEEHLEHNPHPSPLAFNRDSLIAVTESEMRTRGFHAVKLAAGDEVLHVGRPSRDADVFKSDITLPPTGSPQQYATIRLHYYYPNFKKSIMAERNKMFAGIGAVILLFHFVLQGILRRVLTRPIMRMVSVAQQFAAGQTDARFEALQDDELGYMARFINSALDAIGNEQRATQCALQQLEASKLALQNERDRLEQRVEARTAELKSVNIELEAYSYSIAHDLRQPLRAIDGFSLLLLDDYADRLDKEGNDNLRRVRKAAQRMGQMIDDILELAKISRSEMTKHQVDVSALAGSVLQSLKDAHPRRRVLVDVAPGLVADTDRSLLRVILENLFGNAWKYSARTEDARIEFGAQYSGTCRVFYVRDNGIGFDTTYSEKMFRPFERLHNDRRYEGTGIGLATVARAVQRIGGEVWAESSPGKGATFYFSLSRCRK